MFSKFLEKHKVAIYYMVLSILLISLISGAILLEGKSPTKTYSVVGSLSDVTEIKAKQANGTLCKVQINRTNKELILNIDPPAHEVQMYIRQKVLDLKPNFLSLDIRVSGQQDFIFSLQVQKAGFADGYNYVNIGRWILSSKSGTLTLGNLQINQGLIIDREGNPSDDRIRVVRTDFAGYRVIEDDIKYVKIGRMAFISEKEGREPTQAISLDSNYIIFSMYFLLMLFVFPLAFLKIKKSSLGLLFIIGFLLRILIAPFTSHNFDVLGWKQATRMFYEGGKVNLFTNWTGPPFWFFTLIIFYAPYTFLRIWGLPDIQIYSQPILSIEVTFLKLPLILSDMLSAFLIYKICRERNLTSKVSKTAVMAYLFNPFTILVSSIWGMFDSLAISFVLLGFYLCVKKRFYLSSLIWGLGIKWFSIGFIPFLSMFAYFQNKEEKFLIKIAKSALILVVGFGFFAFQMVFPYLIYGDVNYLKQVMEFRLKVGGGGGDVASLTRFSGLTSWKIFEYISVIELIPDFFLLTFLPLFLILLALFFVYLRKLAPKENDALPVFNSTLIAVLFIFYITYPQLTPQCVLWVLPFLILGCYLFNRIDTLPIILISLISVQVLEQASIPYFTIGFWQNLPYFPSTPILNNPLIYTLSASFIPIGLYFALFDSTLYSKIGTLCKSLFRGLDRFELYALYTSTTIFMFIQAMVVYALNIDSLSLLPLLILTIFLQSITFFGIEANRGGRV